MTETTYEGVHSCGPNCTQPLCVANRRIKELEALNKMHLPNVELLHKILTQRPYPSGAEWQFLEAWAEQFIRLNKPNDLTPRK